eukprot:jgi/Bigna1/78077/fgenesh1_pg.52_\
MQVARAKAIREQRLRQQRALQQALQKEEDVKSSAPASSKHNQKLPLASPGLDLRAIQGTPAGSHGGNSALSLQEVLDQSLKSMNSLEKLSQMHERQFSGRREATAQTPVRRKSSRSRSHQPPPSSSALSSVPRNHAARAHERNDRYMSDWHDAYNHMNGDSYKWGGGPPSASSRASKSGGSVSSASRPSSGSRRRNRKKVTRPPRKEVATRVGRRNTGGQSLKVVQGGMSQMTLKSGGGGWSSEPDDSKAIEIKSSGRPILCMSVMEDEAVVGSSDHALYAYDLSSGVQTRQMFDKRNGHREWVSWCVPPKSDFSGVFIVFLNKTGHTGSISAVGCTSSSSSKPLVISASYDKTVRAFDLRSRRQLLCFSGHKGPVLSLDWAASGLALSGGRGGIAIAWDLQAGGPVGMLKGHKGHVTVVRWLQQSRSGGTGSSSGEASVFMTGAQDGHLTLTDFRLTQGSDLGPKIPGRNRQYLGPYQPERWGAGEGGGGAV